MTDLATQARPRAEVEIQPSHNKKRLGQQTPLATSHATTLLCDHNLQRIGDDLVNRLNRGRAAMAATPIQAQAPHNPQEDTTFALPSAPTHATTYYPTTTTTPATAS